MDGPCVQSWSWQAVAHRRSCSPGERCRARCPQASACRPSRYEDRAVHRTARHRTHGEARALAFLLDRFWVLERSVDVQGADLIVQRPHMAAEMTVTARSIRLLPISPASR